MNLSTTRFGEIAIEADDIFLFPGGLAGFENLRHWVLLADADNEAVGWLQSVAQAEIALPVVSPRRFAPEYQVRVGSSQLANLRFSSEDEAYVLAIASQNQGAITLNLRAPLIINLDRRLGQQVITSDEQPLQFVVQSTPAPLRKSA